MSSPVVITNDILTHKEPVNIVPFCIFHYINPFENTYRGYIGNPKMVKNKDGSIGYKCASNFLPLWPILNQQIVN